MTISVEACSTIKQELLIVLEKGNKVFQKFEKVRLLKNTGSVYSLITRGNIKPGIEQKRRTTTGL